MSDKRAQSKTIGSNDKFNHYFSSIAGLVLILTILFITLKLPCPSNSQYVIFRIILSIAIGGFAVVISGFFRFAYKQIITAGGALAVFAFVYLYTPKIINTTDKCNDPFDYTIFLQDSVGNSPIKSTGLMSMKVGSDLRSEAIDAKGSSTFKQIPINVKDSFVQVQLQIQGWQFNNSKNSVFIKLSGDNESVIIQRDNSLCCVSGSIRDPSQFLKGAQVRIGNISTTTDENGLFSLTIPPDKQKEEYKLIVQKEGYKTFEASVFPVTKQEVEVILEK